MEPNEYVGRKITCTAFFNDDDEPTVESGIIVAAWYDSMMDEIDCYIAFYGLNTGFPKGVPSEKPYILRYFLKSLELVEDVRKI